jgi:hypothetical protein
MSCQGTTLLSVLPSCQEQRTTTSCRPVFRLKRSLQFRSGARVVNKRIEEAEFREDHSAVVIHVASPPPRNQHSRYRRQLGFRPYPGALEREMRRRRDKRHFYLPPEGGLGSSFFFVPPRRGRVLGSSFFLYRAADQCEYGPGLFSSISSIRRPDLSSLGFSVCPPEGGAWF